MLSSVLSSIVFADRLRRADLFFGFILLVAVDTFLLRSFSSVLFADLLKRADLFVELPFLVEVDRIRGSPEACRPARQASSCSAQSCLQAYLKLSLIHI